MASSSSPRSGYHHGDLKRVLVEAALAAIERDGHEALSLASLADAAYRRFEAGVARAMGGADDNTIKASTIAVWSAVFGFAVLTAEGRIKPFMRGEMTPEQVREQALEVIGAMLKP